MANLITVDDLVFKYDEEATTPIIDHLSLSVKKGEWLAIIGHNGSGKSTFSKLLIGLLEAQSGTITVDSQVLSEETVWDIRSRIGLVFQNPDNQFVGATVEDDVAFGLENAGIPHDEMKRRVEAALRRVNMWEFREKEPAALSGGQKQRVAIAGILALGPEIIIFDESTAMLDPEGRSEVADIMKQVKEEQNLTVISITHDLKEAAEADRIIVFKSGQVVDEGTPEMIFKQGNQLTEIGLGVPFSEQLKQALKERRIAIPEAYMTNERLADWLCKLNSEM